MVVVLVCAVIVVAKVKMNHYLDMSIEKLEEAIANLTEWLLDMKKDGSTEKELKDECLMLEALRAILILRKR